MRILVLGARGMLGHMVCRVLRESHDTYGSGRGNVIAQEILPSGRFIGDLDVRDQKRLGGVLERIRPEVVINCVGLIKQKGEAEDPIAAIGINALLPHQIALQCDRIGAKLIQPSTDCVFSGRQGNYSENDNPDPVDLYGRSKLLGEVIRAPHLTIRTSIIGRQLTGNESLLEWFISQRSNSISGYTHAIFSGLTTHSLSTVIDGILRKSPELTGIYHIAAEPITKFDLLSQINSILNLDIGISKDGSLSIDRSLDGKKFERTTGIQVPSWEKMLSQLQQDWGQYEHWRN